MSGTRKNTITMENSTDRLRTAAKHNPARRQEGFVNVARGFSPARAWTTDRPSRLSLFFASFAILRFFAPFVILLLAASPLHATEPTLARLSFWLPSERMAEFENAYEAKVVPILKRHGLTESPQLARATADSAFTRLFEVKTPADVAEKREALNADPAWKETLRHLETTLDTVQPVGLLTSYSLAIYTTPAGPGKTVSVQGMAGKGHWRTYSVMDGLPDVIVRSVIQDRQGNLWFGTIGGLNRYDGKTWTTFGTADALNHNWVYSIIQDRAGDFWFAHWGGGVSRYDGRVFQSLTQEDGLADNGVRVVFEDREGHLWFGTHNGVTRYRPPERFPPRMAIDAVAADRRYAGVSEVSIPSTTKLIAFEFHAMSLKTRPDGIVYRYRLNGYDDDWKTTRSRRVEYQDLPGGTHTFEVEAVDRDLVYSEQPATLALTVRLPYERLGLLSALGIAVVLIAWQSVRVVLRGRRLQASDFDRALSLVTEDLKVVGLTFETCSIDVLDEPADAPTMAYFEQHGFRYTTYTIHPDGAVTSRSYHIQAPVPPVNLEMIERFIAGEPWQGTSGRTAMVEVPITRYGRLRLTAPDREFAQEDIDALKDFAAAIALGYARYLDIREIQEQTERKSAFLASMSHELRTPMNAIKGFTNLVLRRRAENLTDRQRGNLSKVIQASDHLLAMINDLLDLSKIEAGRMDVTSEPFDVKALVAACCATVEPLISEKPDVTLIHDVPDDIGQAHTDGARVRQMLINLLSNAVKFTDAGSVTVKASRQKTGDGIQETGELLVIAVADTGKGIPADEIDTIFDEYRQVKGSDRAHKGTGLGLSITKKFAELLGGSISVESEE